MLLACLLKLNRFDSIQTSLQPSLEMDQTEPKQITLLSLPARGDSFLFHSLLDLYSVVVRARVIAYVDA